MERWVTEGGAQSQNPITPEVLSNPATYGAFLDVHDDVLETAMIDAQAISDQGGRSLIEIHWNGVSSFAEGTKVDIFHRGAENPDTSIWVKDGEGLFSLIDVGDLGSIIEAYPDDVPIEWMPPGFLAYIDDPGDQRARGLHILDAEGRAIALWDHERNSFKPWIHVGPQRHKLVNGMDVDFYGFSDEQLDILWEAFAWIMVDEESAPALFEPVGSVRATDLPAWIAGVAGRGDIHVDPRMFNEMRDYHNAPRQADVLWIATILVHEAAHLNQPGECTQEYAAARGMSFTEYGLFIETGPGQAYEQEVVFLARILNAKDEEGNSLLKDPMVRRIVQGIRAYSQGALGQAVFPDGEPISTCANP